MKVFARTALLAGAIAILGSGQAAGAQTADSVTVVDGTGGPEFLYSTNDVDFVRAYAADDRVYGRGEEGTLHGGDEDDLILAGSGGDLVIGGSGNEALAGGLGNDSLNGRAGNDEVLAGFGNDFVASSATGVVTAWTVARQRPRRRGALFAAAIHLCASGRSQDGRSCSSRWGTSCPRHRRRYPREHLQLPKTLPPPPRTQFPDAPLVSLVPRG